MKAFLGLALVMVAGLGGCATSTASGPVEVTRFHLGAPLEKGTLLVEPLPGGGPPSLEFKTYAAAVESELLANGYTSAAPGTRPQYLAVVSFTRATRDGPPRSSGLSLGLGGGSYGGGVGVGGGVSLPIGKRSPRRFVGTELAVQIRRQSDGTVTWEGRALTEADDRTPDAQANVAAGKLASALFRGFPGESGRSITVK